MGLQINKQIFVFQNQQKMNNPQICSIHNQEIIGICLECPCSNNENNSVCQQCIDQEGSKHYLHQSYHISLLDSTLKALCKTYGDKKNQLKFLQDNCNDFYESMRNRFEKFLKIFSLDHKDQFKKQFDMQKIIELFENRRMFEIVNSPLQQTLVEIVKSKKFFEYDQQSQEKFKKYKDYISNQLENFFSFIVNNYKTGENFEGNQLANDQELKEMRKQKQDLEIENQKLKKETLNQQKEVAQQKEQNQKLRNDIEQLNKTIQNFQIEQTKLAKINQEQTQELKKLQQQKQQYQEESKMQQQQKNNQIVSLNNKQQVMQESLKYLDKNNSYYQKNVDKWNQVYDTLVSKGKKGFCGKETNDVDVGDVGVGTYGTYTYWTKGYCGTTTGTKSKWNLTWGFYCCEDCWKEGEGNKN
eukprot:TRINITY_DN690_c0_g1_i16.p1 TRINITY_DN690_c0_g1~~TRINITY_DN690_c0_g1_i16.p1  ORF type:complete len:413 (-),score=101.03 TRINITY_DN690_c0_g1_i16:150-1388(-)